MMEVQVWIEPVGPGRFRATAMTLSAEGATPDEAKSKLRQALNGQIAQGAKVERLSVGPPSNPWLAMAGMWDPKDPLIQEWKQIIAENRTREGSGEDAA